MFLVMRVLSLDHVVAVQVLASKIVSTFQICLRSTVYLAMLMTILFPIVLMLYSLLLERALKVLLIWQLVSDWKPLVFRFQLLIRRVRLRTLRRHQLWF